MGRIRGRTPNLIRLEALLERLIMNVHAVAEITGLSQPAANELANALEEEGLLVEISGKKTYRILRFEGYCRTFGEREDRS